MSSTPITQYGKDHWSLLAYVEAVCVDGQKGVGNLLRNRMRCNPDRHPLLAGSYATVGGWKPQYGTRLRGFFEFSLRINLRNDPAQAMAAGVQLDGHDDWDCLNDLEASGFVEVLSLAQGQVRMTALGLQTAALLRAHRAQGGMFDTFVLEGDRGQSSEEPSRGHESPLSEGTAPDPAERLNQTLASALTGLRAKFEQDSRHSALEALGQERAQELVKSLRAGQFDALEKQLLQPAEDQARAIAALAFEGPPLLHFLLTNWSFVSSHVRELVKQFEGTACCADKTRTILKTLAHHLAHGSPYSFNREQQYTFHLPTKVLLTAQEALSFVESLAHMSQGRTGPYLQWMHWFILEQKAQSAKA